MYGCMCLCMYVYVNIKLFFIKNKFMNLASHLYFDKSIYANLFFFLRYHSRSYPLSQSLSMSVSLYRFLLLHYVNGEKEYLNLLNNCGKKKR